MTEKNIGRRHRRIKRQVNALLLERGPMTVQQIIEVLKQRPRYKPDSTGKAKVVLNHNTPTSISLGQILTCCPALFRKAGEQNQPRVAIWEAVE